MKNGKRVTPQGEPITIEFLLDEPSFQPHHSPFIKNLTTARLRRQLRMVDPVQFRKRVDDFDFDIVVQRFAFSSDAGRFAAQLLLVAGRRPEGSQQSGRDRATR